MKYRGWETEDKGRIAEKRRILNIEQGMTKKKMRSFDYPFGFAQGSG
ncbi:MAG: hypothetical protein WAV28_06945 [Sedimentisphaerales bacterium]